MNARICAICVFVLVALDPIQGMLNFGFNPFGPPQNPNMPTPDGGPFGAMMGIQRCRPSMGNRRAAGPPGAPGAPLGAGLPRSPAGAGPIGGPVGMPGQPISQSMNPMGQMNPMMFGMVDVPDAPDVPFGCFCTNMGNECFGLGMMGTDPVCSKYFMCCSCDGMMDFGLM